MSNGTSVAIVVRQQAWFRPHIDVEGVAPFPVDQIDAVQLHPSGVFRARVLIGRGPVDRDLGSEYMLWFDQGESEYPSFQMPGIGTPGGAVMLSGKPRRLMAAPDEALCLVEVSLITPVTESFANSYRKDSPDTPNEAMTVVQQWLAESKRFLEQAIGLYALYQYPVVWEPLGTHPFTAVVDLASQSTQIRTIIEGDVFIPFRLKLGTRIQEGYLVDGGLASFGALAGHRFHFPLLLLQRALWQRNVQLRFLETFFLLEYLVGQSPVKDQIRDERAAFYDIIEDVFTKNHPEHLGRVKALKHLALQAPLRERIQHYLTHLGVKHDVEQIRQMLAVRNDLAHARQVDGLTLVFAEGAARALCREALRRELAAEGVTFGPGGNLPAGEPVTS